MNAAILASFAVGQETEAVTRMLKFWDDSGNETLYHNWWGSYAEGLLWKGGLYNDKKLKEWLDDEINDIGAMQRFIDVGLTDLLAGTYNDEYKSDLDANLKDILFAEFS